jgi:murein DD-endopeptidase MepM/ murein hydrolase activator NlpD
MKWLLLALLVSPLGAKESAPTKRTLPPPRGDEDAEAVAQPSGYVHLIQPSDRLPKLAKYYGVSEQLLREVNAELFAYNESQTGHRMIINEPIILPLGCFIPRGAAWARRADDLTKIANPTVITTPDTPASQNDLRTGSGWAPQYSSRRSKQTPLFKPAITPPAPLEGPNPTAVKTDATRAPLAYGVTTSDLPSPKTGAGGNRHARLSSVFGWRSGRRHKGIDIPMDANTPIVAAHDGTVERADHDLFGYGNFVIINHGRAETRYAHLNRIMVQPGQHVTGGKTIIGLSGDTGHSTGPHLHFELRVDGEAVDPVGTDLPGVQAMLAGSAAAAGRNDLSSGLGSLNYTFEDKRWQLHGGF